MGGFEGGDEAGFWDSDTLASPIKKSSHPTNKTKLSIEKSDASYSIKAHAKATVFLKITGYEDGLPTLLSRYLRVEELYDTISFVPCTSGTFIIEGCNDIPIESNTIYKAYKALLDYTADTDIEEFFNDYKVVVTKRIPIHSGLGGASSDAAAFMHLIKEACNLILSSDELLKIGSGISTDVPFFICNYPSANISGLGEIVEPFEEEPLNLEWYTPEILCDTTLLYQTFQEHLSANISLSSFSGWDRLDTKSILKLSADPALINDLYASAILAYPTLTKGTKKGWFFSGSSFFKLLD